MEYLAHNLVIAFILAAGGVGLAFAVFQWWVVSKVKVGGKAGLEEYSLIEDGANDTVGQQVADIQSAISEGTARFLLRRRET